MQQANEAAFRWINRWPESIAPEMHFLSTAMDYLWFKAALALLLIGLLAFGDRTRRTAVQALLSFVVANTFTEVFKHALPTHRPFQILPDAILRVGWSDSAGTASAHSANMASVAFVFAYHLGRAWGIPWFAIAFLVGLSRIYTGAHFPAQVLLGWACGLLAGFLVTSGWDSLRAKRAGVVVFDKGAEAEREHQTGEQ